jgi:hypothetical protein
MVDERMKDLLLTELWQDPNYEIHQVPCPEIAIEDIDKTLYGNLLAEANAGNAKFDGTKVSIAGCEFDWNYDAEARVLRITCVKKPFYATCATVESRIRELVAKAKESI